MNNFIFKLPAFEPENYFTSEVIMFIALCLSLVVGVLLCFWGYKYAQTLLLIILGCFCGNIGIRIGEHMTENMILKLCFFVMFTFFGICMLYGLSILLKLLIIRIGLRDKIHKRLYVITAVLGGIMTGMTVYFNIFKNLPVVCAAALILIALGIAYGKKKASVQRIFYTYDDLYRMKPAKEEETDA